MFPVEFALSKDQLTMIVDKLQVIVDELKETRDGLLSVAPSAFGGSWMGSFVHSHSQKAYDAISEALADNSAALLHYRTALEIVDAEATKAEDATRAALVAQRQRAEQQVVLGNDCSSAGAGDPTTVCEAP